MIELRPADAERVRHLFDVPHLALVIEAVVAGNSPATIWADDARRPRTAVLWDGAHSLHLTGAPDHTGACRELFRTKIVRGALVKVYATRAAAEAVFSLAGDSLRLRERVLFRADRPVTAVPPPDGFHLTPINEGFAGLARLANFASLTDEIESCWNSLTAFRRTGFGFCAHTTSAIASWCTAEYVSPGQCGIGIETVPEFQRRGIATATASAFLGRCAAAGVTPHWDSWSANLPSVAIATGLGLTKIETYSVYVYQGTPLSK